MASFSQEYKSFEIAGSINLDKAINKVFIYYISDGKLHRDSSLIKENEFEIAGKITEPIIATLGVQFTTPQRGQVREVQFFLTPGFTKFNAQKSINNYNISGNEDQLIFQEIKKIIDKYEAPINILINQYLELESKGKGQSEEGKAIMDSLLVKSEPVEKIINENVLLPLIRLKPNSAVALYALKRYAKSTSFSNPEKIDSLLNNLSVIVLQYPSALELKEQIEIEKITGSIASKQFPETF